MLQKLADKALALLVPRTSAAATWQQQQFMYIQGDKNSGCDTYQHRWRKSRWCTYTDSNKLVSCTSWVYYACGW
ncbi:hypothetical protein [Sphaerisporangium fuscum]|uniref:hypothetical protein n=1 Tax=Sphaerisporangium fuscum TaxID=2835868 RepID=UPI001BDBBA65|nr:hypothetical protein [Sphaerisporangium fuscum]